MRICNGRSHEESYWWARLPKGEDGGRENVPTGGRQIVEGGDGSENVQSTGTMSEAIAGVENLSHQATPS